MKQSASHAIPLCAGLGSRLPPLAVADRRDALVAARDQAAAVVTGAIR